MNSKINAFAGALLGILILFFPTLGFSADAVDSTAAAPGIKWQPWSDSLFQQAKKKHKPILIYGHSPWCHWCKKMDESLQDPAVIQYISANYIPAVADAQKDLDMLSKYNVSDLPSILILDGDRKSVKLIGGYLSAQDLLTKLKS